MSKERAMGRMRVRVKRAAGMARLFTRALVMGLAMWVVTGCSPPAIESAVLGDIRPPMVKNARLESGYEFILEFDEPVRVPKDSFSAEPKRLAAQAESFENVVSVLFEPKPSPGEVVTLAGTVQDMCGNSTRVQVQFKGYNDRPAGLVITEIQTAKNTSKKAPHRDYIEFLVKKAGNLGGMYVQWASSTKTMRFDFPACEVRAGEVIVFHLAPEGLAEEKNETGSDLGLSGGIDATAQGRDFWSDAGGLPDASGAITVHEREGALPIDGIFYADSSKSGKLESAKLIALARELADAGLWKLDVPPLWENALLWKPSTSRPLVRTSTSSYGASAWGIGESGSQSPGIVN